MPQQKRAPKRGSAAGEHHEHWKRRCRQMVLRDERQADRFAHEFRGSLTVIKEYASLLRDDVFGSLDEQQKQTINVINDRTDDLNQVVDDMLSLQRLRAGTLTAVRTICRLPELLERLLPGLREKAALRGAEIQLQLADGLDAAYCDPDQIEQTLIHLARHVLRFGGEPSLVVIRARNDRSRAQLVLDVAAEGLRTNSVAQDALFDQLKRLIASRERRPDGLRVGLTVSRELVDLNFGTLTVATEAGERCIFSFDLPCDSPYEVLRRYLSRFHERPRPPACLSAIRASLDNPMNAAANDEVDRLLNYASRRRELVLRVEEARWLIVSPVDDRGLALVCDRFEAAHRETNQHRVRKPLPGLILESAGAWTPDADAKLVRRRVDELFPRRS